MTYRTCIGCVFGNEAISRLLSTLESLQRENERLNAELKREAELATHMANDCSDEQVRANVLENELKRYRASNFGGWTVPVYAHAEPVKTAPAVAVPQILVNLATAVLAQAPANATEFMGIGLDDIRSALSAQVQDLAGWQPIETAPRDGSEFQAWIKDYGWEPKARINLSTEAFEIWGRVDYDEEGWSVYPHMIPSHWMPLPASPASKHGDAE